ncbi:MAG: ABC transporter permease [Candidatus Krumholzibacteriaceae bacterium]|jgi:putative ABC transport system permease protein
MKWKSLFKVAFKSIMKNRMRSFLTMLGIIIGVASVIALISVGKGTQSDISGKIQSLGTNLLIVVPGSSGFGGVNRGAGSFNTLTMADADKLEKNATLLLNVSPVVRASGQIIAGRNNWFTSVQGVSPSYPEIRTWPVDRGSFFTDRDEKSLAKVAVLGATVADTLFPGQDPVGARIRIRGEPFTVVGVLSRKGQNMMGSDQDDIVLAPATTVLYRLSDGRYINSITVSAVSESQIPQAEDEMTAILRSSHRLTGSEDNDFSIRSQTEINDMATSVTRMMTLLLSSVAGVSLLVGGIGIMNIMLVSVTERTREIGIRLAIGAREADVLTQFLVEAGTISLMGGLLGILLGLVTAGAIGRAISTSIVIDPVTMTISFLFSGIIGIFFGFYPAKKAAALNPIEALHYE